MTLAVLALLVIAAALVWAVVHRAAQVRREAQSREARALEALLTARREAGGGANIDLDMIFGGPQAAASPASADAVLRAAGLRPEVVALLGKPPVVQAPAEPAAPADAAVVEADRIAVPAPQAGDAASESAEDGDAGEFQVRVPVRDLVQVFYEARGFRATPADPSARPIELVLTHKEDALRSYAFVPMEGALSESAVRSIIRRARRIDQLRVLIATEGAVAPELVDALPAKGVRVFDRATIEAQLARLNAAAAEKLLDRARRRTARRLEEMG